ncbi:MAG: DNA polymerase I [Hyphomonadaceae bacterium]|nr:DNA polymerase I [Hyphomonadaceae bacterium]
MPVKRPVDKTSHVYLIDASGFIFRAFHALPPLTRKTDGLPVGAVSGFCNMLWKVLEDLKAGDQPTHFACIFDAGAITFRNELYDQYKAQRPPPPEDLIPQFPLVRRAAIAFGQPALEMVGFEADDLIATYSRQAAAKGARVSIVSADKDLMQLVDDRICMLDTVKDRKICAPEVFEKFGVTPDKVIDVQALCGDSVDNVPGVPGIGIKTAALLIQEYGDLETLLARAGEIKQPKRRESLIEHADKARLSKILVTLKDDVPVATPLEDLGVSDPDPAPLIAFLEEMEFRTLTKRVAETLGAPVPASAAKSASSSAGGQALANAVAAAGGKPTASSAPASRTEIGESSTPLPPENMPFDVDNYETVTDAARLGWWIEEAKAQGFVAVDTETDGLNPVSAKLVGVSLALAPGKACYIPLAHGAGKTDLLSGEKPVQVDLATAMEMLKPMLEDPAVLKIGQNIKYDISVFCGHGIRVAPIDDTMLLSFVLSAGANNHGMDELSELHLGHKPIPIKDLIGSGKTQITFDQAPLDKATRYAAEDADVTLRLWQRLKPRISREGVATIYETQDRPLIPVVADMERAGVLVDRDRLSQLSGDFAQGMARLEDEAHKLAGHPFNLGSPKQIGEILFDKMGLADVAGAKKTKTGAWATGADTLEDLAAYGHELPKVLLDWRMLSKLRSTYTETLRDAIDANTGRVHTSYSLAGAQTGRLASTDPNLQNIPIRTEEGRKIREAFIAEKGNVLVSADYSQIELRLLAHVADIPSLRQAFLDGIDIHAMTASEMFNVPVKGMDPMVRRRAKAINFGIIYGISGFGLARQLSIPREEAAAYIKKYFQKFPGIQDYMEHYRAFAREHGYVSTIFGRKVWLPQIKSPNGAERSFGERQAINAPLQGSAADIIKRAMIRMPAALKAAGLKSKMLLQVHDELVFEAPEKEAKKLIEVASAVMAKAPHPVVQLNVPLVVEAHAAKTWAEAH